ncbi:shikimate dehydrogenase family protein [Kibdelosporangium aridum]|uniref:shikimate dehydrogenase family protein n=1 Tax=Kibdelosporangium aridum TaxID=2030 RepID=UPI0006912FAA
MTGRAEVNPLPATDISGTTRLYAVLGDPVVQVRAPALLNSLFTCLGVDAVLVPVHVQPCHLGEVVRGLQRVGNLDGMLVTVPHKIEARVFADAVSPAVTLSGSTNALRREPDGRWFADNFDGAGFVLGLRANGFDPAGKRVSLVGAGGAGGAIAAALLEAGVDHLAVCDRDEVILAALGSRMHAAYPNRVSLGTQPRLAAMDLVVNATPLGLRADDALPLDVMALSAGTVVADIIMKPRETALLRAAAARGHVVHHGEHMLTHQLDLYREFFRLDEAARSQNGAVQ